MTFYSLCDIIKKVDVYYILHKNRKTKVYEVKKLKKPKAVNANVDFLNSNKFEKFCHVAISIVFLSFMVFLVAVSMFHTTGMEVVNEGEGIESCVYSIKERIESIIYYNDFFISNIFWFVISTLLCFIIIPRIGKIPVKYQIVFIFVWTILFGTIWVYSSQVSPSEDSWRVVDASAQAASNNFSFMQDDYVNNYSYQLGYILFNEVLIRIHNIFFSYETTLFIQVINVVLLAFIYSALIMINKVLFSDNRICAITTLLFAISLQPIVFCVFTYGIFPGLAFALWAVYFEIKYLKTNHMRYIPLSAVLIGIAIMIKSNYLIFFIAMVMLVVIKLFSRKRFIEDISFIVIATVLATSVTPLVKYSYEKRSGVELRDSVPYSSWIAMGLNETDLAPGWYNINYTVFNLADHEYDAVSAGSASTENIKERISYFAKHPQYTSDFFYLKTVSQWNETSYQSIWNNQVRIQYKDKGTIASYICGDGESQAKRYMDIIAQFVFATSLIGIVFCLKNKNISTLILPIIVFGGFLYHTISEGKSQYIIPYYILLVAFGAYGICKLYDFSSLKFADKPWFAKMFVSGQTVVKETTNSEEEIEKSIIEEKITEIGE